MNPWDEMLEDIALVEAIPLDLLGDEITLDQHIAFNAIVDFVRHFAERYKAEQEMVERFR